MNDDAPEQSVKPSLHSTEKLEVTWRCYAEKRLVDVNEEYQQDKTSLKKRSLFIDFALCVFF